jgi:DNA-binding beta-propeller fold protein YncE
MPMSVRSGLALAVCCAVIARGYAGGDAYLQVEAKIPLASVAGRIDHLAYDVARRRLFVAELGNNSVDVIDIDQRRAVRRITGFDEPQGVAYSAATNLLYVASGGDGKLRAFDGDQYRLVKEVGAGDDADNVRVDERTGRVYVGAATLAVFDAATMRRVDDIRLKGHPESFQLWPGESLLYANIPGAHEIAVIDLQAAHQVKSWPSQSWLSNYPMAVDAENSRVYVVFRQPPTLAAYQQPDGKVAANASACGDADDVFVDRRRGRIYVICGAGVVDVFDRARLTRLAQVESAPGARTGFYSPEADRLFVAARAQGSAGAMLWVFKPL